MQPARFEINVIEKQEGTQFSSFVECELKMQCELLKDQTIVIPNNLLPYPLSLSHQQTQHNNNSSAQIIPSIWTEELPFANNDNNNIFPVSLPLHCDDCEDKFFIFRYSVLKFSSSGKCRVPISFKIHDEIPLNTTLSFQIEILLNGGISLMGQTVLPFKRTHNTEDSSDDDEESEQEDNNQSQTSPPLSPENINSTQEEVFQKVSQQLRLVMDCLSTNPENSQQVNTLKRRAELLLTEVNTHLPEKKRSRG
eukprot:TRINITY_DN2204_c0_g2_i10.p1 TRINITY_DN2204_c0_g2~~TRINITY_DN2204_c0_g2_i10.p1  ORF type:complete len:252 (+),score=78.86 TRINITY_DN2204_c0_g2_i10:440-1195(+)